jgi:hypothetical protein
MFQLISFYDVEFGVRLAIFFLPIQLKSVKIELKLVKIMLKFC